MKNIRIYIEDIITLLIVAVIIALLTSCNDSKVKTNINRVETTLLYTSPTGDKVYETVHYGIPGTVTMFVEDRDGKITCYNKQSRP